MIVLLQSAGQQCDSMIPNVYDSTFLPFPDSRLHLFLIPPTRDVETQYEPLAILGNFQDHIHHQFASVRHAIFGALLTDYTLHVTKPSLHVL